MLKVEIECSNTSILNANIRAKPWFISVEVMAILGAPSVDTTLIANEIGMRRLVRSDCTLYEDFLEAGLEDLMRDIRRLQDWFESIRLPVGPGLFCRHAVFRQAIFVAEIEGNGR